MGALSVFLYYECLFIICGIFLTLIILMATGRINIKMLFYNKSTSKSTPEVSLGRIQLLVFTVLISGVVLWKAGQGSCELESMSSGFFFLLGGSSATYLGAKLNSIIREIRSGLKNSP